jgi:hypothetical protein
MLSVANPEVRGILSLLDAGNGVAARTSRRVPGGNFKDEPHEEANALDRHAQ